MYEPNLCTGCFKSLGIRGETTHQKADFHRNKDNHECLIPALQALATQDTPQGRSAARQLARYIPMVPTPPLESKRDKPSEDQHKIATEALTNPIYLNRIALQKQLRNRTLSEKKKVKLKPSNMPNTN